MFIFADPDVAFARMSGVGCRRDDAPAIVFKRDLKTGVFGPVQEAQFDRGRCLVIRFRESPIDGKPTKTTAKLYNLTSRMFGCLVHPDMAGVSRKAGVQDHIGDQRFLTAGAFCKVCMESGALISPYT
jgi:hypothetical protein